MKNETHNVLFIIDAGYLSSELRPLGKIDFCKLRDYVENNFGNIARGYYITSYNAPEVHGFHSFLKSYKGPHLEVLVKSQKTKSCNNCGNNALVERGVDVAIATQIIKHAHRGVYDRLVLINGDADLLDALVYVRDEFMKEIIIFGNMGSIAPDVQVVASKIVELDEIMKYIRSDKL